MGVSSDATHLAKPDATGQVAAMRASLADSGLEPSAIGYINAHGTATPVGDVVETQSIREAFGAAADRVAVSSTKALHGHLLGASGAVEFIAAADGTAYWDNSADLPPLAGPTRGATSTSSPTRLGATLRCGRSCPTPSPSAERTPCSSRDVGQADSGPP